jgi:hypothetical protein
LSVVSDWWWNSYKIAPCWSVVNGVDTDRIGELSRDSITKIPVSARTWVRSNRRGTAVPNRAGEGWAVEKARFRFALIAVTGNDFVARECL